MRRIEEQLSFSGAGALLWCVCRPSRGKKRAPLRKRALAIRPWTKQDRQSILKESCGSTCEKVGSNTKFLQKRLEGVFVRALLRFA